MKDLINKLPFILPAIMAFIIGVLGLNYDKDLNFIYVSMLVSILIFAFIGLLARNFILTLFVEEDTEENNEADNTDEVVDIDKNKGKVIDFKVDDSHDPKINDFYGDDFSPLEVSKVIKTNISKDDK